MQQVAHWLGITIVSCNRYFCCLLGVLGLSLLLRLLLLLVLVHILLEMQFLLFG